MFWDIFYVFAGVPQYTTLEIFSLSFYQYQASPNKGIIMDYETYRPLPQSDSWVQEDDTNDKTDEEDEEEVSQHKSVKRPETNEWRIS